MNADKHAERLRNRYFGCKPHQRLVLKSERGAHDGANGTARPHHVFLRNTAVIQQFQLRKSAATQITASRNARAVFVTDFGARGDGVRDDSKAIEAALIFCSAAGRGCQVNIPRGTYKVTKGFTFNSASYKGISVVGEGVRATVIRYAGSGWLFTVLGSSTLNTFSDISIFGSNAASGAIWFNAAAITSFIDRVEIADFPRGTGVRIGDEQHTLFGELIRLRAVSLGNVATGVSIYGNQIVIEDCDFSEAERGIQIVSGSRVSILKSSFQAGSGYPISVAAVNSLNISGSYFELNGADTIKLQDSHSSGVSINDNYFKNDSAHYDLRIDGCTSCTINNNTFAGRSQTPARVYLAGGNALSNVVSFGSANLDVIPTFQLGAPLRSGIIQDTQLDTWTFGEKDGELKAYFSNSAGLATYFSGGQPNGSAKPLVFGKGCRLVNGDGHSGSIAVSVGARVCRLKFAAPSFRSCVLTAWDATVVPKRHERDSLEFSTSSVGGIVDYLCSDIRAGDLQNQKK